MKLIFLQISKKKIFPKLIQNLVYSLNMSLTQIFDIDQNIIKISNDKNILLFSQNLVDISIKYGQNIR